MSDMVNLMKAATVDEFDELEIMGFFREIDDDRSGSVLFDEIVEQFACYSHDRRAQVRELRDDRLDNRLEEGFKRADYVNDDGQCDQNIPTDFLFTVLLDLLLLLIAELFSVSESALGSVRSSE